MLNVTLHAQMNHLNLADGLSQSTVFAIAQDSSGFMWFGTMDGLNRYDGYSFRVYKHIPFDKTSLSSGFIRCLTVDPKGRLWIGTENGGLLLYQRHEDRFENCTEYSDYSFKTVYQILSAENDSILILTDNGVFIFNYAKKSFTKIINPFSRRRTPYAIVQIGRNKFMIGTREGKLWVLDLKNNNRLRMLDLNTADIRLMQNVPIRKLYMDHKGEVWIGTLGKGLFRFNPKEKKLRPYRNIFFKKSFVIDIFEDQLHRLWVGTRKGLFRIDSTRRNVVSFFHNPADPFSVGDNSILSIFQSRDGTLWIGQWTNGISYVNEMHQLKYDSDIQHKTSNRIVLAILKRGESEWFIGTNGRGLIYYNRKNNVLREFSKSSGATSHPGDLVQAFIEIDSNTIWCGTWEYGIKEFNVNQFQFKSVKTPVGFPKNVHCFSKIDSGHIWIGTDDGIWEYEKSSGKFSRIRKMLPESTEFRPNVWTILKDSRGEIWIGTMGAGIFRYDPRKKVWKHYQYVVDDSTTVSGNTIWTIYEDHNRRIWIGTDSGLNLYQPEDDSFRHYFEANGLPNNTIFGIVEDNYGRLWISTNNGISAFKPDVHPLSFKNYYQNEGMPSNECNMGAYGKDKNGYIYFGTIRGVFYFKPEKLNIRKKRIPVRILSLDISHIKNKFFNAYCKDRIEYLKYSQNSFRIQVALMDFINPQKNMFSFYLKGFDKSWSMYSNSNSIQYTNLPPGDYQLWVRAKNSNGTREVEQCIFKFKISPPFWSTLWFRSMLLAFILSLFYIFHQIKITRIRELHNLRIQIASDLHDDIGASLSKIALYADTLGANLQEKSSIPKRISELSREVIHSLRDLVWAIDTENDTWDRLASKMKEIAYSLLPQKGIKVGFQLQMEKPEQPIPPILRQNIYLIFKEAVHNVYKHSNATKVDIYLRKSGNSVELIVEDNGRGMSSDHHHGHGLKNMKRRAKKINGELLISSQQGTKIQLILK
jgi:ligand-binding sensor domain-containing protein/signal transduction histidine kinase